MSTMDRRVGARRSGTFVTNAIAVGSKPWVAVRDVRGRRVAQSRGLSVLCVYCLYALLVCMGVACAVCHVDGACVTRVLLVL